MQLSIIIPTLNESRYLPRLLDSIAKQDFVDYEIIIADGGSSDGTQEIARSRGCIVVTGGSPARGRNAGAVVATGTLLLFLDADAVLSGGFLSKSVQEFQKGSLGIAGFKIIPMDGNFFDAAIYGLFDFSARFLPHAAMAIMVTAQAHRQVGGFDELSVFMEDFDYVLRMSRVALYRYLPIPFSVSMRRLSKYSRWLTYLQYLFGGLYVLALGPIRSDKFRYRFDGYQHIEITKTNHRFFWHAVSLFGTPLLYVPAIFWPWVFGSQRWLWRVAATILLVEAICWSIKFFYRKDRPEPRSRAGFFSNIDANSFPSIHTARITSLATLFAGYYMNWFWLAVAVVASGLVGCSRVALKRHFPIDVWSGFAVGALIAIMVFLAI